MPKRYHFPSFAFPPFAFALFAFALMGCAMAQTPQTPLPPVRIILVGDSTMAVKSGYGPGFCADVVPPVTCLNMAKGGRSSGSYRAEGSWAKVMDELNRTGDFQATYVLIQFGHNDQPGKPGRSTALATEFPANLRQYVTEVKAAGAKPVLVTPLARRSFQDGKLKNDLEPWADAARKVASEEGAPLLELNAESVAAVQKMGPVEANTLAMAPAPPEVLETAPSGNSIAVPKATPAPSGSTVERPGEAAPLFDYTHLGVKGSAYFGRMVADELVTNVRGLRPYFQ
ncbi:MAG TPA: rhamnogalacturonan acetylesterase [Candidatus Acidoferrales bacterium]|nr:rhamnogalacturonan acetylesterase [Candidatus Acidoferrales bacterium]